jgi:hypothetical protein
MQQLSPQPTPFLRPAGRLLEYGKYCWHKPPYLLKATLRARLCNFSGHALDTLYKHIDIRGTSDIIEDFLFGDHSDDHT